MSYQFNPNIYVSQQYHNQGYSPAAADAEALYKSMKGLGTNDKVLSEIIATRTREQLQVIKQVFAEKYKGDTLAKWIKGDTSGHYEELLLSLIDDKFESDAKYVNHAIKGLGTNDEELVELICTRNNSEILGMKQAYQKLFGCEMEKDVKGDTSGDYKDLLVAILKGNRNESAQINLDAAKADAHALYKAGEGRLGTNEKVFIDILTTRSYPQLFTINQCYAQHAGHSLEHAIKKETSGNFCKALILILTPREEYFAKQLHKSIKGLGTEDHLLIRVLNHLSTYPGLFKATNNYYMHEYKHNIENDVGGDTSGWYSKTAVHVIKHRVNL